MARNRNNRNKNTQKTKAIPNHYQSLGSQIAPKSISQTRKDIQYYRRTLNMARNVEGRQLYPLYLLYQDILLDALLMSQKQNRLLKALDTPFMFKNEDGKTNDAITEELQNKRWVNDLCKQVLESIWFGHSLVELIVKDGVITSKLIPRTNVNQFEGFVYRDYTDPTNPIKYRELEEYGKTILEFGEDDDLGLLNNAVPHVLMKRFATSCHSELCEIYGIPPRVMKTNTHNPAMMKRSEQMMRDMGAAAWFIIDESEHFEFAQGVQTNGDVYKSLIALCNSEISLVSSGAIIGQDTQNGSRSKDESAQTMLQQLINSDLGLLEEAWNTTIIPALQELGILPNNIYLAFEITEDITDLWTMTKEALPYYEMDIDWMNRKFGLQIKEKRATGMGMEQLKLKLDPNDFF